VWSPVYVDALVLRDRDTDADGMPDDERLWVTQDANWNVTAVVDDSGVVAERFVYDPFGVATIYSPSYGAVRATRGWARPGKKGSMVGGASVRGKSGPRNESGPASLKGAGHTRENAQTNSKHRTFMIAFVGMAALATVGIVFQGRTSRSNTRNAATSLSSEANVPNSAIVPSVAPTPVPTPTTMEKPALASNVTITFTGAPEGTKVFRGDAEIGSASTPLRLPRQTEKVTLRFSAESFESTEMQLIPDVDQTVTVTLKSAKPVSTTPIKRKVPKELEGF